MIENNPQEKREFPRKKAAITLKVSDLNTEEYVGNVVNISPGGIMMVTHLDIQANSVYQLRINIPDGYGKLDPIVFGGEILWIDKYMDKNKRWAGIQIIDISDEMTIRLVQLIDDFL
jgi:PilZ domain